MDFPVFRNNTIRFQRPYNSSLVFHTLRNVMPTGLQFATYTRSNPQHRWVLNYPVHETADLALVESLFRQVQGRLGKFGFTSPEGVYFPECRFDQDVLEVNVEGPSAGSVTVAIWAIERAVLP